MFNIKKSNTGFIFWRCFEDVHESPIYRPDKRPKRFWSCFCLTELLLKFSGGRVRFPFYFARKNNHLCLFVVIRLKVIFHWFAQAFILLKSLFKLVANKFS